MSFWHSDEVMAGLRRGAAKFGTEVAKVSVRIMSRRTNDKAGDELEKAISRVLEEAAADHLPSDPPLRVSHLAGRVLRKLPGNHDYAKVSDALRGELDRRGWSTESLENGLAQPEQEPYGVGAGQPTRENADCASCKKSPAAKGDKFCADCRAGVDRADEINKAAGKNHDRKNAAQFSIPTGNAQLIFGYGVTAPGYEFEADGQSLRLPKGRYRVVDKGGDHHSGPWGSFSDLTVERVNSATEPGAGHLLCPECGVSVEPTGYGGESLGNVYMCGKCGHTYFAKDLVKNSRKNDGLTSDPQEAALASYQAQILVEHDEARLADLKTIAKLLEQRIEAKARGTAGDARMNASPKGPDDDEYFTYLDGLRESGVTNMFGAGEYLVDQFALSKNDAREVLSRWMSTFGERHKSKENSTKVSYKGSEYDLEIVDSSHAKMRLSGTDAWGTPLHVAQLFPEVLEQLRKQNQTSGNFLKANSVEIPADNKCPGCAHELKQLTDGSYLCHDDDCLCLCGTWLRDEDENSSKNNSATRCPDCADVLSDTSQVSDAYGHERVEVRKRAHGGQDHLEVLDGESGEWVPYCAGYENSTRKNADGQAASGLGYQSGQETTTADRSDPDHHEPTDALGYENERTTFSKCPECGAKFKKPISSACPQCGASFDETAPGGPKDPGAREDLINGDEPWDKGDPAAAKDPKDDRDQYRTNALKNSYGSEYIKGDQSRGMTDEQVADRIVERYRDISREDALLVSRKVRAGAEDAWGHVKRDMAKYRGEDSYDENGERVNSGTLSPESWAAASSSERAAWLLEADLDPSLLEWRWEDFSNDAKNALQLAKDRPASLNNDASGLTPQFTFVFRDQDGEDEEVTAADEAAAWAQLSADFGTPLEDIRAMGIRLVTTRKNASSDPACSRSGCPHLLSEHDVDWKCELCSCEEFVFTRDKKENSYEQGPEDDWDHDTTYDEREAVLRLIGASIKLKTAKWSDLSHPIREKLRALHETTKGIENSKHAHGAGVDRGSKKYGGTK